MTVARHPGTFAGSPEDWFPGIMVTDNGGRRLHACRTFDGTLRITIRDAKTIADGEHFRYGEQLGDVVLSVDDARAFAEALVLEL